MTHDDVGPATVERVRDALSPERGRIVGEPRGFSWWPHAHVLHVHAEPARADGAVRIVAETALLGHVGGRGAEFAALTRWNAREAALSSLRWDAERGEVSLRASAIARPGDGDVAARLLAHAALLQVGEALRAADALAIELPDASLLSPRPPGGEIPSRSPRSRRGRLRDAARPGARGAANGRSRRSRGSRPRHGCARRTPRTASTPSSRADPGTARRRRTPRAGCGARAWASRTRAWARAFSPRSCRRRASSRSRSARRPRHRCSTRARRASGPVCDALGGWCVHPTAGSRTCSFVPALALEDGTAERLAWQAGTRARWAPLIHRPRRDFACRGVALLGIHYPIDPAPGLAHAVPRRSRVQDSLQAAFQPQVLRDLGCFRCRPPGPTLFARSMVAQRAQSRRGCFPRGRKESAVATGTVKWFNDAKGFRLHLAGGWRGRVRALLRDPGEGFKTLAEGSASSSRS
jgi:hypothetical protein